MILNKIQYNLFSYEKSNLKLKSFLLSSNGNCKLFNFGDITYSKDNTIITDQSYDDDYFNLAVIICQMLTGDMNLSKNDLQNIQSFNLSIEAKQLIENILAKNYQNIKNDSFFQTINWTKLENGLLTPPFKPDIVNSK
jgi:hypothetical protein